MQKQTSKGFFKKMLWEISQNSQGNFCIEMSFFDKVKLCRSAPSLKARPQRRCFLVNFAKFVRTPFLQNTTRRRLLIIPTINKQYDTFLLTYAIFWGHNLLSFSSSIFMHFFQFFSFSFTYLQTNSKIKWIRLTWVFLSCQICHSNYHLKVFVDRFEDI